MLPSQFRPLPRAAATRWIAPLACTLFVVTALGMGCATGSRRGLPPPYSEQEELARLPAIEAASYRDIQKTFQSRQYEAAVTKAQAFEKRFPRSTQLAQVYNLRGLASLLDKKTLPAIHYFRKSADSPALAPGYRPFVLYNLAAAQFEAAQSEESLATLALIEPLALDRDTRIKFHTLKLRVVSKTELHSQTVEQALALSALLGPTQTKESLIAYLERGLEGVTDRVALGATIAQHPGSPLLDLALYRLGSLELLAANTGAARAALGRIVSEYPGSLKMADARSLLDSLERRNVVEPTKIGILLPLKGRFAGYGQKALLAAQLALGVFGAPERGAEAESPITLVVEDSGDEPEQALRALNRLYERYRVIAVIGPMMSKGVDRVSRRAQELGLPMITLSQQPGVSGEYIFQSGLTPQVQAREMARYAIQELGLKRFAILHPRDRFGDQYSSAYWDAVDELGGKIVGIESYAPGETDFRAPIDKLSGLYYEEARKRELDALAKLREELKITKRTRKTEAYYALKPIVDYDAVFIPDEPKILGQILPTFSYRDVDNVRFLGTATWNSRELLVRAQGFLEGAYFVDAFFAQSNSPVTRRFTERFRATFASEPSAIEALTYDAVKMAEFAWKSGGNGSRDAFRDALRGIRDFPGVTGRISCGADQFFARNLTVLSIKNNQILPAAAVR